MNPIEHVWDFIGRKNNQRIKTGPWKKENQFVFDGSF
jgi:ligand-binding SRPBCC domain-containing protein